MVALRSWSSCRCPLLDATRADGTLFMLKAVHRINSPAVEIPIRRLLPSRRLQSHLIDFDLFKEYAPGGPPRLEDPPWGGDRTVPENLLPGEPPYVPFPVDVYCLRNCIKQNFLDVPAVCALLPDMAVPMFSVQIGLDLSGKARFEFTRELVGSNMVNTDPLMSEVFLV
ncbi:hypothetical protein DXG01_015620 [Tephrocybe rancida]|nr:hypothetical protein DXG01_015620 [Tephrocybe rancida]